MADIDLGKELIPRTYGSKDCTDPYVGGIPSQRYDWVQKNDNSDVDLDEELLERLEPECQPWYYYTMKVGDLLVIENVNAGGEVTSNNGTHVLSNKKNFPFDMDHPTKPGWRLRHVCLEGPEIGVYLHGKSSSEILELPDYWRGLVKPETITVHLTAIGPYRQYYVDEIKDNKVYIGSHYMNMDPFPEWNISPYNYNYIIHASRYDDDLIVEYPGKTYEDYPGGNEGYAFSFENNNIERIIRNEIDKQLNINNKR